MKKELAGAHAVKGFSGQPRVGVVALCCPATVLGHRCFPVIRRRFDILQDPSVQVRELFEGLNCISSNHPVSVSVVNSDSRGTARLEKTLCVKASRAMH